MSCTMKKAIMQREHLTFVSPRPLTLSPNPCRVENFLHKIWLYKAASTIGRRFFTGRTLDQPSQLTWRSYKDETLLQHLMRYQFLLSEPVIAEFGKLHILTRQPGDCLEFRELADSFMQELYGKIKPEFKEKLSGALQATGLVTRSQQMMYVRDQTNIEQAFGVLLHALFSPQPTMIAVQDILNHLFWSYLGLRAPSEVIKLLRALEAKKILMKYVSADQLFSARRRGARGTVGA